MRAEMPACSFEGKKKAALLPDNITLIILSDDPLAPLDIANYCQHNNYDFKKRLENHIHHLFIIPRQNT